MNSKAQAKLWAWVFVIIVVLVVVVLTVVIIINQKADEKDIYGEDNMVVYLSIKDSQYQKNIEGSYILTNKSSYIFGNAIDSLNEIKNISNNYTLTIFCMAPGFYSNKLLHNFTIQEQNFNSSKINCYLEKVGSLILSSNGILQNGETTINLNIESKGHYKNLQVCTRWSSGVINVVTNEEEIDPPKRYVGLVDRCYDLNISLYNQKIQIPFKIKSENLNQLDYVDLIVFDKEIHFDGTLDNFYSEYDNINLGSSQDSILKIKFE